MVKMLKVKNKKCSYIIIVFLIVNDQYLLFQLTIFCMYGNMLKDFNYITTAVSEYLNMSH